MGTTSDEILRAGGPYDPAGSPAGAAVLTRHGGRRRILQLAFVAPALLASALPDAAAASRARSKRNDDDRDDDDGENGKKDRGPARPSRAPSPAAPAAVQANQPAAPEARPRAQGTQRMTSDPMRLQGSDGTGAGPVRIDLEGAQANSGYQVAFVPASNPGSAVHLGTIRTDGRGTFHGAAPQPMPPIPPPGRAGVLMLSRLPSV